MLLIYQIVSFLVALALLNRHFVLATVLVPFATQYWNSQGEGTCSMLLGQACVNDGEGRPAGCGALALVTIWWLCSCLLPSSSCEDPATQVVGLLDSERQAGVE